MNNEFKFFLDAWVFCHRQGIDWKRIERRSLWLFVVSDETVPA